MTYTWHPIRRLSINGHFIQIPSNADTPFGYSAALDFHSVVPHRRTSAELFPFPLNTVISHFVISLT